MANTTMPNGTQYHTWKPEPLVRGTFSILSSSLLTMVLCVWTSVHLNIPEHETDEMKAQAWRIAPQTWRKLLWMVIAIFAPEWVVFTAYRQHVAANDIGKTMRKAFGQPDPPGFIGRLKATLDDFLRSICDGLECIGNKTRLIKQPKHLHEAIDVELDPKFRRHPWTQTHSLYATMGGFAVDTRGVDHSYLPDGRQRMILTPEGLRSIADHVPDLLPDLPESAIVDKSKANAFTKLVTCGQALWFGVQCATRSAQGLSVSLLEMNTTVHAICTLIMYFSFWWHKPLNVEEPTILTHVDTHSVIAFLAIGDMFPRVRFSPLDMQDSKDLGLTPDTAMHHPSRHLDHMLLRPSRDANLPVSNYNVYHGFAIPTHRSHSHDAPLVLSERDFQRFDLAYEAVRKYGSCTNILSSMNIDTRENNCLAVRVRNRPKIKKATNENFFLFVGFPLAGLFYGSIHLLVWNRSFRGEMDELLWKISSLTILISGAPLAIGYRCMEPYDDYAGDDKQSWEFRGAVLFCLFLTFAFLFYVLCRTFIIVECFLDVFHLPDSAFEVPQWSQYFPHIG